MSTRRLLQRGYTAVELMMAISVFGIGVAGIISMEKVTSVANQHAKNLAIATHIAESWLDTLSADGGMWNHPRTGDLTNFSDIGDTTWLKQAGLQADGASKWFFPAYNPGPIVFGPAFDALGNPVNPATNPGAIAFCSHLRLSWLYQPDTGGNGLIRAEVRVFWLRDGQAFAANMCAAGSVANINNQTSTFHFVQKITAIREASQ
ncbi:MAG TPA: prepilin-type N-terminal cleavage/methylation domain-containing protein [Polyangiaceae bacterium]|nr:prepilin-type N-terminal cleavage/methylation domain-containing protein [Polyangiaceae bacterium]